MLYEYFHDLNNSDEKKIFNIEDLTKYLHLNDHAYNSAIEKLEAVGLVCTWKKENEDSYIYNLIKPSNIESIDKNPILKNHLIKVIGKIEYERIYFNQKKKYINKNSYKNISRKYQDVFPNNFEENIIGNDEHSTLELSIESYGTHEENIYNLPSSSFIKYFMKRNPTYYDSQLINSLLKIGFNDNSINLLINFSVNVNNDISHAYILKIARDFIDRSIVSFNDVEHELKVIEQFKKNKKNIKKSNDLINDSMNLNKNITLEEIFNEDDIKGMF